MNVLEIGYNDYETLLSILPKEMDFFENNENNENNVNLLAINHFLKYLKENENIVKVHYLKNIKKTIEKSKKLELQNIIKNINYSTKNNNINYSKINLGNLNSN